MKTTATLLALLACLLVSSSATAQELKEASLEDEHLKHERLDDQKLYKYVWAWIYYRYHHPSFSPESWKQWEHKYDGKIYSSAEATTAINAMISTLNDRNVEMIATTGEDKSGTIGCELEPTSEERCMVRIVGKDSEGARKELHVGDIIETIGNIPARGTLSQITNQLSGPPNTEVFIQAIRSDKCLDFQLTLRSEDFEPESYLNKLNGNIAYIKPAFPMVDEKKRNHFISAMQQLSQATNIKGVIVDLRSNMNDGSYIADICGCFIGKKRAYGMLSRGNIKFVDGDARVQLGDYPIVALINSTSNTSAEALAACLKINKRAKLIGDTTSGRSLVIYTENVDRYSRLRLPEWEFVGPDGSKISGVGVTPDISVPVKFDDVARGPWWNHSATGENPDINTGHDVQLQRAIAEMSK